MENVTKDYFIGLDVGTDSVGYAVTDMEYNLLKHNGEPMWGATVFEAANNKDERRSFRSSRRRLDRRQQRILLTQEIFADEISKIDEKFFLRIKESALYSEDKTTGSSNCIFNDKDFNDKDYNRKYPTIHHLIDDLMKDKSAKDARLVYLAVAWFMAHRGHFLNEVDKKNVSKVLDFDNVYNEFIECFSEPVWNAPKDEFKKVMLKKLSVTRKEKAFLDLLNDGKKFKDGEEDEISKGALVKLLSGGKIKPESIFLNNEYEQMESVSLGMPEENFSAIVLELGDDGELLLRLRAIYDWALLSEILGDEEVKGEMRTISSAKIKVYEQHKRDVAGLKAFVRKYIPKSYFTIFRDGKIDNYAAYSGNTANKKCDKEAFSTFLLKELKKVDSTKIEQSDREFYEDMLGRLELKRFIPKQVDGDNRVIPYQLYWHELNTIIENAKSYLPFLNEADKDGYTNAQKIMSIFEFRVPYFVGPLRTDNTQNGWMKRKEGAVGKIYPWNFYNMVDLDLTEQDFINRMTNKCTYLPGEDVIPKCSLLYSKFMVLNEINNIKVNGIEIPVEIKWQIFEKFKERKKVSIKMIKEVLMSNGCMTVEDIISGVDQSINSSLASYHSFKKLLESKQLTENEVEEIIKYITYSEDRYRFSKWLENRFSKLDRQDRKYISNLKFKDFGRLSERFLIGLKGVEKSTGEMISVMDALWNTNDNLMQILSGKYTFSEEIEKERLEYYEVNDRGLEGMLDDMYISNAVKRPIYRTLSILEDVRKATKVTPKRIFIEMAKGGGEKGKRTKSRRDQIKDLYANYSKEEVRELSKMLDDKSDNELQSEVLFLYFMQLGRCMYSGEAIDIDLLKTSKYNVDHIYPQSKLMDDSLSNKVLVLSTLNGEKGDGLIPTEWRNRMATFWKKLKECNMISEEKYRRLMRSTPFTEEELKGFINRQLVETRQSTKALANILQKLYPDAEVVYVKAGLVSEFRKEFDMLKCRSVNDLHHGKDAYLNIVCGNVYHCRFTKNFHITQQYSLKVKTIFTHKVNENGKCIWNGEDSIAKVRRIMRKNNLHYTRFAFERRGGLFDQMPVKKGKGAVPRKADLSIEKYGGYNKSTATFFMMVKYLEKKKTDIMFMPVDLWAVSTIMQDEESVMRYAKSNIAGILGKKEEDIEILGLPLGLRRIKINTVVSLDGYRCAITGKASGGVKVGITSLEPMKLDYKFEKYIKGLEKYIEKKNNKKISKLDSTYDKITKEDNIKIYNVFTEKTGNNKYKKMFGGNEEYLLNSRDKFYNMELEEQVIVLINVLSIFKTGRAGGCDLREIGGKENSAKLTMSSKLSNWKKYNDVRIVDMSASGIYEIKSQNLLELL